MAKKNKKEASGFNVFKDLKEETAHTIYSVISFVLSLFFILALFNKAGVVGEKVYGGFHYLLGLGYFLLPLMFLLLGIVFIRRMQTNLALTKVIGGILFLFSGLGIIGLTMVDRGGVIGTLISLPLFKLFDFTASLIILIAVLLISLLVMFDTHLSLNHLLFWRLFRKEKGEGELLDEDVKVKMPPIEEPEDEEPEEDVMEKVTAPQKETSPSLIPISRHILGKKFTPPPLSLLERDRGKPGVGDIKANANIIKRTLQNFGIIVEMDEISIGPSVTRYALKPAEGVKLSRIVALQNDLSLALAAHPIRIEAPIPGKSLVGIEIPNTTKTTVGLASLLSEEEYQSSEKPLLISLGRGISGKSHFANLAKAPHLLIAGATGSGKSVTIHAILTSLLYRNSPQNLKFIMIDPKRVELTLYNRIPHLLTPVITDAKKAILSLKWAAKEMDRRYDILEGNSVRDIESYHKNILSPVLKKFEGKEGAELSPEEAAAMPETMPYIVIVIDELADIMQAYPRELESAIVRLAQMSRAVGIHLILSTQRPSVNVITGLIKANVPSRVALQVTSQIDSRTILDMAGAEKLLGAGDMLFMSGEMAKPVRVQSSFISEVELKKVVKYLADNYANDIPEIINLTGEQTEKNSIFESQFDDDSEEDELYEEAREIVVRAGKASTSYLQRKLRIGYARAARLIDMLEEKGVIGAGEGAKPREVLNSTGSSGAGADEEI